MSESSKRYLKRQAKDPYTNKALKDGYRSRAAYKLLEINEKAKFLHQGLTVVDLGAAPGGWVQVCRRRGLPVVAIDKLYMDPVEGAQIYKGDFADDEVYEELLALCPEGVDIVLSDMAPETSGHAGNDHLRIIGLAEMAADFAKNTLKPGGVFLTKIFQGGEEVKLRDELRKYFTKVSFEKPAASRKDSKEIFILCQGFNGGV